MGKIPKWRSPSPQFGNFHIFFTVFCHFISPWIGKNREKYGVGLGQTPPPLWEFSPHNPVFFLTTSLSISSRYTQLMHITAFDEASQLLKSTLELNWENHPYPEKLEKFTHKPLDEKIRMKMFQDNKDCPRPSPVLFKMLRELVNYAVSEREDGVREAIL